MTARLGSSYHRCHSQTNCLWASAQLSTLKPAEHPSYLPFVSISYSDVPDGIGLFGGKKTSFHSVHESLSILCFRFWKCGLFYVVIEQNFCHQSPVSLHMLCSLNIKVILVLNKLIMQSRRKPVGKSACILDLGTVKSWVFSICSGCFTVNKITHSNYVYRRHYSLGSK